MPEKGTGYEKKRTANQRFPKKTGYEKTNRSLKPVIKEDVGYFGRSKKVMD